MGWIWQCVIKGEFSFFLFRPVFSFRSCFLYFFYGLNGYCTLELCFGEFVKIWVGFGSVLQGDILVFFVSCGFCVSSRFWSFFNALNSYCTLDLCFGEFVKIWVGFGRVLLG